MVLNLARGCRDGAAVRVLTFHQAPIPGLSLLLILVPARRAFLRVLRFSSLHKNQHPKFQFYPESGATGFPALLVSVTLTK